MYQFSGNRQKVNMFRWLLLATVLAVCLAEEAAKPAAAAQAVPDSKAEESASHYDHDRRYDDYGEDLPGTGVLREIYPSGHPLPKRRIEEQNKIVYDRYSPTYYQPQWILDYRYLKTGGRDYVRGEGGQILILPKGMKAPEDEHKNFGNFDELLEFLRLQELAEREDLHRRRQGHNEHSREEEHRERETYRPDRKQNVGWEREAEREQRYDDRMDDMIKEVLNDDGKKDRRERWQNQRQLNGWERKAFGK